MSTFSAQDLAFEVERHQAVGRDVLVEPVLYDPTSTDKVEGTLYRPLTRHELTIAQRFVARAEKQQAYHERRRLAAERRQAALERAERTAYGEKQIQSARVGIATVAAATKGQ